MTTEAPTLVGRDSELDALFRFLDDPDSAPRALLVEGEAGIGKSTLLRAADAAAAQRGCVVLRAAGAESEAQLPFAGLADVLGPALDNLDLQLPEPQRRALEVALLRRTEARPKQQQLAVSLAALEAMRVLAQATPVVLVIDDVQWLDGPTAHVIGYVSRRIEAPLRVVAAVRTATADAPAPLEEELRAARRLLLGPLAPHALAQLLHAELGSELTRADIAQIHAASRGNPYFALELARAGGTGESSVPDALASLLRRRIATVSPAAQRLLVAAAAAPALRRMIAEDLASADVVDEAIAARILEAKGPLLRFEHPLLASVVYQDASPRGRREAHRLLADAAENADERAAHLALAAEAPDASTAAIVAEAADRAAARGAPEDAARLMQQAAALTPPDDSETATRRTLAACDYHIGNGNFTAARRLARALVDSLPQGAARAEALGRLAEAAETIGEQLALLEEALGATDSADAQAELRLRLAVCAQLGGELRRALAAARAASTANNPATVARALAHAALLELYVGERGDRAGLERALALERTCASRLPVMFSPTAVLAERLLCGDDFPAARPLLEQLEAVAAERGSDLERAVTLLRLAFTHVRAGAWDDADAAVRRKLELSWQLGHDTPPAGAYVGRALVDALRGDADAATDAAERAVVAASAVQIPIFEAQGLWVLGLLALSRADGAAAHWRLAAASAILDRIGATPLPIWPALPDDVEALAMLGELERAERLLQRFDDATALQTTWARARSARGRALIAAARTDLERALEETNRALEEHAGFPDPLERARTMLVQGTVLRRLRRRREARETLQHALAVLEELGARLWAERAREELGRIGGRGGAREGLTESERRAAKLAAEGLTNREIAEQLFVSEKTVEAALSRVYRKLGVRSRTELVRVLV